MRKRKESPWQTPLFLYNMCFFDKQDVVIELTNYAFQRRDGDRFGSDVMAQNIKSLGHRKDSLDSLYAISLAQFREGCLLQEDYLMPAS